ncbi:uncharacterized protein UV8b_03426 [Ustilaginoidea virens]|uniref:RNA-dependent RNA polymerase n=1 Tax=Ustilaginoidea virens TaxID=1159556 RepID=A0A8E5HPV4_USTVR|nr:uncharacterized protein UV8b_03426 [Ustilaginoidea virens]QUC19185.1 hypothetical protein UV8b_03426 [Ustilaginoidea virens]
MEVILKNIPSTLTDDNFKRELIPFMNALGIVDWTVDKPRRKPHAWISFLQAADGVKFLKKHGQIGALKAPSISTSAPRKSRGEVGSGYIARLHILSNAVYAFKSHSEPKDLVLQSLRHERDERLKAPDQQGRRAPAIACTLKNVSCGRIILEPPHMGLKFIQQASSDQLYNAKFGRQCLTVTLLEAVRLDIPYDMVQEVIADDRAGTITLVLEESPRFYSKLPVRRPGDAGKWERLTACPLWVDREPLHCLVYQLVPAMDYHGVIRSLKNQDILSLSQQAMPALYPPLSADEDSVAAMKVFEGRIVGAATLREAPVPFPILFQTQALVWNNYLHPRGGLLVLDEVQRLVRKSTQQGTELPLSADVMKRLFQSIPYPVPGADLTLADPSSLLPQWQEGTLEMRSQDPTRTGLYGPSLPQHQAWVFKALVTPTRILLQGPDAESKNRVLRMFKHHTDYFLRVSFCDENGQDLAYSPRVVNDNVYERYRRVVMDGIRVAGRQFSFLGFSHSSLRSHSTWFLAPFVDSNLQRQDRDTILAALGDFRDIRVPAKCAARIGQAFSETPYAVDLFKAGIKVRYIPEVKSADGGRVFSDGVGTISPEAMHELWKALPMSPTCFQIRWGGAKGMLALDPRLQGKLICVRKESMMKFPSRDVQELGICDAATKPLRLYLNRQIIKILEDMGTRPRWFMSLQEKALNILRGVTATATNTSKFLRAQDIGRPLSLPSLIKQLDSMNIDYRRDSFLQSVVEHTVLRELRLLKYKARIPVERGVTLFGIMDETGLLQEGEVYITYDKSIHANQKHAVADGRVLVTRSPALHPGDIQPVKMVTPPEAHPLRALRNCIVFSQKGSRDLPSQLSGGDLDGDLYNIIWDDAALPKKRFSPADYPRVVPVPLDRDVSRVDIADFFINFMKSDILGLIANRHQIIADVQPDGTYDATCVKLAEMHSTAVDYSKTGIPVNATDMPKAPRSRPDFLAPAPPLKVYELGQIEHIVEEEASDNEDGMGVAKPRYHRSEKILGRLYRDIDEKRIWSEDIHRTISRAGPSVWEQLLGRIEGELSLYGIEVNYIHYVQDAWRIRNIYEESMYDNMWHFSDNPRKSLSEADVFCGSVLNLRGRQTRQQRDTSKKLKDEADRLMTWVSKLIRNQNSGDEPDTGKEEAVQLCMTCVVVGCATEERNSKQDQLHSFRVVAAACLLKEMADLRSRKRMVAS